jgi:N-terminal half of MaoC dehydratase
MTVRRFPVESGHVLTFARALGDTSTTYSDATFDRGGLAGVPVPPTFVQASAQFDPEYPLRPQPGTRWWGSAGTPRVSGGPPNEQASAAGGGGSVLHAEQRFEFARPVRVGDVLTTKQRAGRAWDKQGRKGGRLVFSESITEYYDTAGELVVTATAVAVQADKVPTGAGETK